MNSGPAVPRSGTRALSRMIGSGSAEPTHPSQWVHVLTSHQLSSHSSSLSHPPRASLSSPSDIILSVLVMPLIFLCFKLSSDSALTALHPAARNRVRRSSAPNAKLQVTEEPGSWLDEELVVLSRGHGTPRAALVPSDAHVQDYLVPYRPFPQQVGRSWALGRFDSHSLGRRVHAQLLRLPTTTVNCD